MIKCEYAREIENLQREVERLRAELRHARRGSEPMRERRCWCPHNDAPDGYTQAEWDCLCGRVTS